MIKQMLLRIARAVGLRYTCSAPTLDNYRGRLASPGRLQGGRQTSVTRESRADLPLVSIITVVRNRSKSLQAAMDSIRAQTYPNIEYIVVDGASTDDTLDIVRVNADLIDIWISEPDTGIYDAFNKGVALSSGAYIGFLNSDDYYDPEQISRRGPIIAEPESRLGFRQNLPSWLEG